MHYVKEFNINGVASRQVACIELQGKPNAATEAAIGALGVDMTSPTHDVYKCVAVNGSIYTWELLSSGMSIIGATITGEGGETKEFPYESLLSPIGYVIKNGDLILDSEGYLYQVTSMDNTSYHGVYTGTHIGSTGGKTCKLNVTNDGKLQLVTESGAVWSSVDTLLADEDTIYRDGSTGKGVVTGVKTVNDTTLRFFVGTQSEYEVLTDTQKQNLFALITDDTTREDLISGKFVVGEALHADRATKDGNGKVIADTYATKEALNYLEADLAQGQIIVEEARKATKDGNGNVIADTYATRNEVAIVGQDLDYLERSLGDGSFTVGIARTAGTATKADYLSLSNRTSVDNQMCPVSGTGVYLVKCANSKGYYTDIFHIEFENQDEGALTKGQYSSYYGKGLNGGEFRVNDSLDTSAKIVCVVKMA